MLRFLAPRWLAWHATAAAGVVAMAFLGRWQLHRGEHTHSFQNYGYAAQWWCFAAFGAWFWWKTLRDSRAPLAGEQAAGRTTPAAPVSVTAPAAVVLSAADEADEEVAAYNAMLRRLAASPRR